MKLDFVFVVLVYRNTCDLKDFFASLSLPLSKVIVVNSYFDEKSEKDFKTIALKNNADFFSVPNKGYGAGNNRGIEYALLHYDFKYLVVSNADVKIQKIEIGLLEKMPEGIYAPSIHTLSGKQQNPHMPYHSAILDRIKYKFFLKNNWNGILMICAVNKVLRLFFLYFARFFNNCKIYSAHGAFVILSKNTIKKVMPLYDENVFLFTEEENLAMVAKAYGVSTYYVPFIQIQHKEDGSTSVISDKQRGITCESYITFYKKWYN